MRRLLFPLVLACVAAPIAGQQQPITRTTTTGVLIDVTVVDRKGQPVLDLRPEEFELSEEGKRQQITGVSLVHGGVSRAVAGTAVAATQASPSPVSAPAADAARASDAVPDDTPSVTAIMFDRLTNEMRPLAHRAARAHVASMSSARDYAGVYLADTSLRTFASFTNNTEALRAAVDRLGITPATNVSPEAERAAYSRVQNLPLDPNQPVTPSAESGAGWISPIERKNSSAARTRAQTPPNTWRRGCGRWNCECSKRSGPCSKSSMATRRSRRCAPSWGGWLCFPDGRASCTLLRRFR